MICFNFFQRNLSFQIVTNFINISANVWNSDCANFAVKNKCDTWWNVKIQPSILRCFFDRSNVENSKRLIIFSYILNFCVFFKCLTWEKYPIVVAHLPFFIINIIFVYRSFRVCNNQTFLLIIFCFLSDLQIIHEMFLQ